MDRLATASASAPLRVPGLCLESPRLPGSKPPKEAITRPAAPPTYPLHHEDFTYVGVDHELCEVKLAEDSTQTFGCVFGAGPLRQSIQASLKASQRSDALRGLFDGQEIDLARADAAVRDTAHPAHASVVEAVRTMGRRMGSVLVDMRRGCATSALSEEWSTLRGSIDTVVFCDGIAHLAALANLLVQATRAELEAHHISMVFHVVPDVDLARGALALLPRRTLEKVARDQETLLVLDAGASAVKAVLIGLRTEADDLRPVVLRAQRVEHAREKQHDMALSIVAKAIAGVTQHQESTTSQAVVAWCGAVDLQGNLQESWAFPTFVGQPSLDRELVTEAIALGARGIGGLSFTHTNDALMAGAAIVVQVPALRGRDVAVVTCGTGPGFAHVASVPLAHVQSRGAAGLLPVEDGPAAGARA